MLRTLDLRLCTALCPGALPYLVFIESTVPARCFEPEWDYELNGYLQGHADSVQQVVGLLEPGLCPFLLWVTVPI